MKGRTIMSNTPSVPPSPSQADSNGDRRATQGKFRDLDKLPPEQLAEFLLSNCIGPISYARAREEVCRLGLDPDKIPHTKPEFKTVEQLIAEQGTKPIDDLDDLIGEGADLWDDDADFERFLDWLSKSRRGGG
jgi:hypothetical protein